MDKDFFVANYSDDPEKNSCQREDVYRQIEFMLENLEIPVSPQTHLDLITNVVFVHDLCCGDIGQLRLTIMQDPLELHVDVKRRIFTPTTVTKNILCNIMRIADQVNILVDHDPRSAGLDTDDPLIHFDFVFNLDMKENIKRFYYK